MLYTFFFFYNNNNNNNNNYLLTYLCPSLPLEHRPSTTPRHRTLFWAALVIPDQLVPCCFSSASVSRLQLLRGRPLFLFPCGFQVRAWRVVLDVGFLRVCPIQPHFLRSICLATGSCPARSHSSSFRIFSCHLILNNNNNRIQRLLTAPRTVSNTYAQVARAQSCAIHVQHV